MFLGGLGLRNLICKHAVFPNKKHIISLVVSFAFFEIMPERCVVYGCNNTASSTKGISLYRIPYWDDSRQIARSRRKKWEDFIRRKRDKWLPSESSVVCSEHFAEECFEYGSSTVEKYKIPKLKRDEVGVTAVPSLLPKATSLDSERSMRIQHRAKVCILYLVYIFILCFSLNLGIRTLCVSIHGFVLYLLHILLLLIVCIQINLRYKILQIYR